MGHGGLHALVLLCLLGVVCIRSEHDGTQCWTKGKGVTINPLMCPAEFSGVDARICCRLCYGANCCMPRRPRVNQDKCPRGAQLVGAIRTRRAVPDVKPTDAPIRETIWWIAGFLLFALIMSLIFVLLTYCPRLWKWCREPENDRYGEESIQARANVQSSRTRTPPPVPPRPNVLPDRLPPPSAIQVEPPPPYSLVCPQGHELPPAYPGEPLVAFQRSGYRRRDDTVVILPLLAASPEAAADGCALEAGDVPEAVVIGGAPGAADLLEAAASGVAPEPPEQYL